MQKSPKLQYPEDAARSGSSTLPYDAYGLFGVLYSASFWNGSQTVS